jgi:hypothetical protein
MMLATIPLSELEDLRNITFDEEKIGSYLESAKTAPEQKPLDFIREGVKTVLSHEILQTIQERFVDILNKKKPPEHIAMSIDAYFRILSMGISPEFIPMFFFIFARQVKNHPLSDDPKIWKYIVDFLPKKVVSPDEKQTLLVPGDEKKERSEQKEEEKRDERYPHIILPK